MPFAKLYSKPNSKNKIKKRLSFGSKIKVVEKKNNFYKFDNLWIKKGDLKKINIITKDPFRNIKKFVDQISKKIYLQTKLALTFL